jgi:hypothetical protein
VVVLPRELDHEYLTQNGVHVFAHAQAARAQVELGRTYVQMVNENVLCFLRN